MGEAAEEGLREKYEKAFGILCRGLERNGVPPDERSRRYLIYGIFRGFWDRTQHFIITGAIEYLKMKDPDITNREIREIATLYKALTEDDALSEYVKKL